MIGSMVLSNYMSESPVCERIRSQEGWRTLCEEETYFASTLRAEILVSAGKKSWKKTLGLEFRDKQLFVVSLFLKAEGSNHCWGNLVVGRNHFLHSFATKKAQILSFGLKVKSSASWRNVCRKTNMSGQSSREHQSWLQRIAELCHGLALGVWMY